MTALKCRPTVVIADNHPGILKKASELLADEFNIVATVSDGTGAVDAAVKFKPDVLVLDMFIPGIDGIEAARETKRLGLVAKFVLLTVEEDADYVEAAHAVGASYVLKSRMYVDLPMAIKEALAGRSFVSPFPVRTIS
jgi:DNA-binding NarL/FixJ family response regulator